MFNKQKILQYVEDKRQKDGGYFFAKIEPSSAADTFYAVKIYSLLCREVPHSRDLVRFFTNFERDNSPRENDIVGLYFTLETLTELGRDTSSYNKYCHTVDKTLRSVFTLSKATEMTVDFDSELQTVYEAVMIAKYLRHKQQHPLLKRYILLLQNKNGGFGNSDLSLLATTYFALASLKELDLLKHQNNAATYLQVKELKLSRFYLEELFWWFMSCHFLQIKPRDLQEIVLFLQNCWHPNGGFCRSQNMGITTIEDTYYAVSILHLLSSYGIDVFI